jgi:hypothetical protein
MIVRMSYCTDEKKFIFIKKHWLILFLDKTIWKKREVSDCKGKIVSWKPI